MFLHTPGGAPFRFFLDYPGLRVRTVRHLMCKKGGQPMNIVVTSLLEEVRLTAKATHSIEL